ncbi:MAG: hypothetical protein MJ174_10720 [Treponema sp.]|nr:hypothetical protein [Treponema sp.]
MNYNEIVNLWQQGRTKWFDYEFEVGKIGNLIFSYFQHELGLDETNKNEKYLKKFPEKDSKSEKLETTLYSAPGCVELKQNGWASFCIRLLVEIDEKTWPKNSFSFVLNIKRIDTEWLVKLFPEDESPVQLKKIPDLSQIDDKEERLKILYSDPGLVKLFEKFCEAIKFQTIDNLDNWLKQEDK